MEGPLLVTVDRDDVLSLGNEFTCEGDMLSSSRRRLAWSVRAQPSWHVLLVLLGQGEKEGHFGFVFEYPWAKPQLSRAPDSFLSLHSPASVSWGHCQPKGCVSLTGDTVPQSDTREGPSSHSQLDTPYLETLLTSGPPEDS